MPVLVAPENKGRNLMDRCVGSRLSLSILKKSFIEPARRSDLLISNAIDAEEPGSTLVC